MLDSGLLRGASGPCETFASPPLPVALTEEDLGDETIDFEVETVEVWGLVEKACLQKPLCKRHVPLRGSEQCSECD